MFNWKHWSPLLFSFWMPNHVYLTAENWLFDFLVKKLQQTFAYFPTKTQFPTQIMTEIGLSIFHWLKFKLWPIGQNYDRHLWRTIHSIKKISYGSFDGLVFCQNQLRSILWQKNARHNFFDELCDWTISVRKSSDGLFWLKYWRIQPFWLKLRQTIRSQKQYWAWLCAYCDGVNLPNVIGILLCSVEISVGNSFAIVGY